MKPKSRKIEIECKAQAKRVISEGSTTKRPNSTISGQSLDSLPNHVFALNIVTKVLFPYLKKKKD